MRSETKGRFVVRSPKLLSPFCPSRKGQHSVDAGPMRLSGLLTQLQVLSEPQVQRVLGQHQHRAQPCNVPQLGDLTPPPPPPPQPVCLMMLHPPKPSTNTNAINSSAKTTGKPRQHRETASSLLFLSSPLFRRVHQSPPANVHVFCPASVNLLQFPSRAWFEHQIFFRDKRMWFPALLACFSRCPRQNSDHTHPC